MNWHVYIVRCKDGTYYTGISTDVSRRVVEHNTSARGARYTRNRRPVTLVWMCYCGTRALAAQAENYLKRQPRAKKEAWLKNSGITL